MRITIKKYVLQAALDKTFAVTGKASADPVLSSVNCVVFDDRVEFTGSDGEITIISSVSQVDIAGDGSVLLPPRFYSAVKQLPEEEVLIESDETEIHISCLEYSGSIRLERSEYPTIERDFGEGIRVSKSAFTSSLTRVRPAILTDTIRPIFMFVDIGGGRVRATDGMKFMQVDAGFDLNMLLPAKAMEQVIRRARGMALEDIEIGETERAFVFRMDEDLLIATKHSSEYPDVDATILEPAMGNDQEFQVDRRALIAAVGRVAVMADSDTNFMNLDFKDNALTITAMDKAGNDAHERLDIHWPYPNRVIGINHNFFTDIIGSMAEPQITMVFGTDQGQRLSSLLFREEGFIGVLMQLRPDLGEAAKGSKRVRAAQSEPTGWGHKGLTSDDMAALDGTDGDDEFDDVDEGEVSFNVMTASKED